jgi:hypothetical protein
VGSSMRHGTLTAHGAFRRIFPLRPFTRAHIAFYGECAFMCRARRSDFVILENPTRAHARKVMFVWPSIIP